MIILVGIYLQLPNKPAEETKLIDLAKQTDEIKNYLKLYPDAYSSAFIDNKLCPPDANSNDCPWMIIFSSASGYTISQDIKDWNDKAYVRIYPNGTIKEALCIPCRNSK